MTWLYKDRQMNSKAYGESIFSINELKQIIKSDGFYFPRSYNGGAVVQAALDCFEEACKRFFESKPSLLSTCWVCVCSRPRLKFFPSLLTGRKLGDVGSDTAFPGAPLP